MKIVLTQEIEIDGEEKTNIMGVFDSKKAAVLFARKLAEYSKKFAIYSGYELKKLTMHNGKISESHKLIFTTFKNEDNSIKEVS